jgi:hypothetical protein
MRFSRFFAVRSRIGEPSIALLDARPAAARGAAGLAAHPRPSAD